MIRTLAFLTVAFVCVNPVRAQMSADEFERGRIRKADGFTEEFSDLRIEGSTVFYSTPGSADEYRLTMDDVLEIQVARGSEATKFFWISAASGAIGAILAIATTDTGSEEVGTGFTVGLVGGSAVVFGLIGLAIGSGQKNYETVYSTIDDDDPSALLRRPIDANDYVALTIRLRF